MEIRNLYKYTRLDGGTDVSPNEPPEGTVYTIMYRMIADEGKLVTQNGIDIYCCIDTESNTGWYEIDDPNIDDPNMEEIE